MRTKSYGLGLITLCLLTSCQGEGQKMSQTMTAILAGQPAASNQTRDPSQKGSVRMGNKEVVVASVEKDSTCSRMVAPFDNDANLQELSQLAGQSYAHEYKEKALDQLNKWISNQPASRANPPAQDNAALVREAAIRMNWLPMAQEVSYGEHYHAQLQNQLLERDSRVGRKLYPNADAMLNKLLATLDEPTPYQFKLYIRTSSGSNAMALPGGFLYIDKPLLESASTNDKAYFALAHELSHVLQRHETRALQARIIDAAYFKNGIKGVMDTVRQAQHPSKGAAVISVLLQGKLVFQKHSEAQELQADACSVRMLHDSFQNDARLTQAIQTFLQDLPKEQAPPRSRTPSSANRQALDDIVELVNKPIDQHPNSQERTQNLRMMLAQIKREESQSVIVQKTNAR